MNYQRYALALVTLMAAASPWISGVMEPARATQPGPQTATPVTLQVTVTDADERLITGLEAQHFAVFENSVRQEVISLSQEDAPLSLGIVAHSSGNLADWLASLQASLKGLLESSHPQSEVFLFSMNKPTQPNGLSEGLAQAAARLRTSRQPKRALLVLSDNAAASAETQTRAKQLGLPLYFIGMGDDAQSAASLVAAQSNGGRAFFPATAAELENVLTRIALELRHQYQISYLSRAGLASNAEVRLTPPRGLPALSVRVHQSSPNR